MLIWFFSLKLGETWKESTKQTTIKRMNIYLFIYFLQFYQLLLLSVRESDRKKIFSWFPTMVVWFRTQNTDNGQHHLGWLLTVLLDTHTDRHTGTVVSAQFGHNLIGQKMCVSTDCYCWWCFEAHKLQLQQLLVDSFGVCQNVVKQRTLFDCVCILWFIYHPVTSSIAALSEILSSADMTHRLHFICRWSTRTACRQSLVHLVTLPNKTHPVPPACLAILNIQTFQWISPLVNPLLQVATLFFKLQQGHQQEPLLLNYSIVVEL